MPTRDATPRRIWITAAAAALAAHAGILVLLPATPAAPEPPSSPLTRQALTVREPPPPPAPDEPPPLTPEVAAPTPAPLPIARRAPRARPATPTAPLPIARRAPRARPATPTAAALETGASTETIAAPPPSAEPAAAAPPPPPAPAPPQPDPGRLAAYRAGIGDAIAAHRRYPRLARRQRRQGTVVVALRLHRDGSLLDPPRLLAALGYAPLDTEAVRMARAAAPFPPLPPGFDSLELRVPVEFRLR